VNRVAALATLAAGILVPACHDEPALLHVESALVPAGARLTLVPAPGVRINARLKPALELPDGTILRFDSDSLTADSSYFSAVPTAVIPGVRGDVHGHLRASVCPAGKNVCMSVELEI
jgi:hypothetical protein